MPPRSQSQGDSKQGLIITVVIAFLLVICLGVTTYFGYSEQDKLDKAAKEAKNSEAMFKDERDYYKAQAMMYRAYMGMADGMDGADTLGTLKGQLDGGSLGKNVKDKADVTKTLKALETKCGWSGNQPKESLEDTIKKLNTQYENLAKLKATTEKELDAKKKELQKTQEDLANARKEFDDNLKKQIENFKQDFAKSNEQFDEFRSKFEAMSQQREKEKTDAEQMKKSLETTIEKLKRDIADLQQLVRRKEDELASMQAKNPTTPENMRTDWKIVRLDNRGTNAYINLGSSDHVRPQLTFTIHGLGSDRRPRPQSKGTLQVVNVIGPHLSQARITSVNDPNRDPIIANDVVYNASWNPNIKKHVAIAGVIDLTGDGRDSLPEFIRNLERQNIEVDAWVDPKDGRIHGQLTYQTDYLILGGTPDKAVGGSADESEKRVLESRKQIQDEAKKYGVPVKSLLSYLEMIGYPLPHSSHEDRTSRFNDMRSDSVPHPNRDRFPPPRPSSEQSPPTPPDK
jgi:hypothetical protein